MKRVGIGCTGTYYCSLVVDVFHMWQSVAEEPRGGLLKRALLFDSIT